MPNREFESMLEDLLVLSRQWTNAENDYAACGTVRDYKRTVDLYDRFIEKKEQFINTFNK